MKEVYLIRHAETVLNNLKRYSGVTDCDLSENGFKQVEKLEEKMKKIKLDNCYVSPLKRALITAKGFYKNPIIVNDLHEMNFGDMENQEFVDDEGRALRLLDGFTNDNENVSFKNGEDKFTFSKRVNNVFDKIIKKNEKSIAIVSHGLVIRTIISSKIVGNFSLFWKFGVGNCGITKLIIKDDVVYLDYLNL